MINLDEIIIEARKKRDAARRVYGIALYRFRLLFQQFGTRVNQIVNTLTVAVAIWCIGNIIWQIGFSVDTLTADRLLTINKLSIAFFGVVQVFKIINYWKSGSRLPISEILYALATWAYVWLSYNIPDAESWQNILNHRYVITVVAIVISINELSRLGITILGRRTSPTILFIGSFIVFIAIGTGLLLMPRCHVGELSFTDALFTATSSVCVSGLMVVEISDVFTHFGQAVILLLIQIGGIGVMTFTCFFALSLTGKASFQNRIVIKDLVSADSMTSILVTLKRIFYVTIIVEIIASWLIYSRLAPLMKDDYDVVDIVFTSIFHAVSSFCNCGISNVEGGLSNPLFVHSRGIQLIMAATIIFGGAGFPLQSSAIDWVKYKLRRILRRIFGLGLGDEHFRSRLINVNNRLMFYTHIGLVIFGTIVILLSELFFSHSDKSLLSLSADAFFLSVNSRTAGFGLTSVTAYAPITLMIVMLLMWIGCAPMSTGGGIKVTTFAVGALNLYNILRRRDNIEIFGRRISDASVSRACASMVITLLAIVILTISLKVTEPDIAVSKLLFESFSAICTGGMTMDLTPQFCTASRYILIIGMFVGRIGVLSFVLCFFSPAAKQFYKYPDENIMI